MQRVTIIVMLLAVVNLSLALTEEETPGKVPELGLADAAIPEKAELFRYSRAADADYQQREPGKIRYVSGPPANLEVEQVGGRHSEATDADASRHASGSSSSNKELSSSDERSSSSQTSTSTTTTTVQQQQQPVLTQLARIQEYKITAIPGHVQPIHYSTSYLVGPAQNAGSGSSSSSVKSSRLEKSESSSSSQSDDTEVIAAAPNPSSVTVVRPVASPDCVLHRLIVERPILHQSVVVEPPAVVPPTCCFVKKQTVARIVEPAPAPSHHLKEEHHHQESRSFREESSGFGHSSSSSSSSNSQSASSKSSESSSVVAPAPAVTTVVQTAPIVTSARLISVPVPAPTYVTVTKTSSIPVATIQQPANKYSSVDVHHSYADPNVRYGYNIKQSSSEPESSKLILGDRVFEFSK